MLPSTVRHVLRFSLLFSGYVLGQVPSSDAVAFKFPPPSNQSSTVTTELSVLNNDSMIVIYTVASDTPYVSLAQQCGDSPERFESGFGSGLVLSGFPPYNNTGAINYHFDNSFTLEQAANNTFCRFILFNESIPACTQGPFGLLGQDDPDHQDPLAYSAIFRVMANNETKGPTLYEADVGQETVQVSGTITSTLSEPATTMLSTVSQTVNVTCPPSGIPAQTSLAGTTIVDNWPKLGGNITWLGVS